MTILSQLVNLLQLAKAQGIQLKTTSYSEGKEDVSISFLYTFLSYVNRVNR